MPKVVMYCTAICPYCVNAERLLNSKGITEIEKIRIDLQPELREPMIAKTGRRTVPQITSTITMSAARRSGGIGSKR